MKAVATHALRSQLGRVLCELRQGECFVVVRRNCPVGVFVSIEDYVREHPDQYEDVEDFMDTFLEESDPVFQRSLKERAREIKQGHYVSHAGLKRAAANKLLAQ